MQQRGWPCLAQQQDIRALAAFRILSGLYLLYDIIERLQYGRLSLLWYTSTDNSFLRPDDTPHRSPIHRFWFYRGSENVQIFLFVVTFLLSLSFMLGYKCNAFSKTLLWLNVVAMQCRCMPPHDGSDTFIRHLLLWSIQLPMSQVWSLDSVYQQNMLKKHTDKRNIDYCDIQNVVAVWGLRLQIVIMYLGTVIHRTYDSYGFEIYKSKWLPPQLTAVHYALHQSLGSRDSWLCNFVRNNLPASQFMTLTGMLIETFAPIMSLIMGNKAHIPAFFLFKLHFGLYVLMNLPNWQFVGMIASVVWLPSWFWNNMQKNLALRFPNVFAPPTVYLSPELMEKKDGVSEAERKKNSVRDATIKVQRRRRPYVTYFLFSYMLYDFVGNRNWFRKFDNGDIGEGIRFSQYWVMFSEPSSNTKQVMLTGTLNDKENVNVWEWMKSHGANIETVDLEEFQIYVWTNMTHVFPSPRIERAFSEWPSASEAKSKHFLRSFCNETPFSYLKLTVQSCYTMPPGSEERYSSPWATVVDADCDYRSQ